jgi:integrase
MVNRTKPVTWADVERARRALNGGRRRVLYIGRGLLLNVSASTVSAFRQVDRVVDGKRVCTRRKIGELHNEAALAALMDRANDPGRAPSFAEVLPVYLRDKARSNSERSHESHEYAEKSLGALAKVPLDQLDYATCKAWFDRTAAVHPRKAELSISILRTVWDWAHGVRLWPGIPSPSLDFALRRGDRPTTPALPIAELPAWFARVNAMDFPAKPFLLFSLFSGLRKMEVATLRHDQVDYENAVLSIRISKTRKQILVPLNSPALEALKSCPRLHGSPYIFWSTTSSSGYLGAPDWRALGKRRQGHTLRSTWISAMRAVGTPESERKQLVGHEALSSAHDGYLDSSYSTEPLRRWSDAAAAWLLSAAANI